MKEGRAAFSRGIVALALLSRPGFGQERATVPAFPTQAEVITADVVVTGKDGRPVRGLTREDFTLLEDGKPQTIVAFEARELAPGVAPVQATAAEDRVATNEGGASRGRTLAFLLDDLGTYPLPMEEGKQALARWLREKADPRDEVTLATSSGKLWWSDRIDRGREDLLAVLDRVQGAKFGDEVTDWEAYRIVNFDGGRGGAAAESNGPAGLGNPQIIVGSLGRVRGRTGMTAGTVEGIAYRHYLAFTYRLRALMEGTERLSRGLAGARGRKAILILSDGFLNDVTQRELLDRTIDVSRRANAAIYFVKVGGLEVASLSGAPVVLDSTPGPSGLGAPNTGGPAAAGLTAGNTEQLFFASSGSEMLAENTGGFTIRDTNDLLGGLDRIADESSNHYLLGYQPAESPDGKWHKLEVKVARPGLKVRTRRGYQATAPSTVAQASPVKTDKGKKGAKAKGPKRPLDPAVMTSGGAGDALPLRLASYVRDADPAGLVRVLVVLEVDSSRLVLKDDRGRRTGAVDLTILGMNRDQGKTFPIDERAKVDMEGKAAGGWMTVTREIRLPPGIAQVRALVRDVASGLAGSVTQRLEVPALDGPYLATPVVTDRMIMINGDALHLVPLAHRRFRAQGHLFCSYEVIGMTNTRGEVTTTIAGGFTLRGSSGQIVRQSSPTRIAVSLGGKVVRLFALPLAGLEAGEYDLVLDVVDDVSGRTLQSHEAFTLEASAS